MDCPVPFRLTICGLSSASSLKVRTPLRVPFLVGVKVTPITQFAPGATDVPHVLLEIW